MNCESDESSLVLENSSIAVLKSKKEKIAFLKQKLKVKLPVITKKHNPEEYRELEEGCTLFHLLSMFYSPKAHFVPKGQYPENNSCSNYFSVVSNFVNSWNIEELRDQEDFQVNDMQCEDGMDGNDLQDIEQVIESSGVVIANESRDDEMQIEGSENSSICDMISDEQLLLSDDVDNEEGINHNQFMGAQITNIQSISSNQQNNCSQDYSLMAEDCDLEEYEISPDSTSTSTNSSNTGNQYTRIHTDTFNHVDFERRVQEELKWKCDHMNHPYQPKNREEEIILILLKEIPLSLKDHSSSVDLDLINRIITKGVSYKTATSLFPELPKKSESLLTDIQKSTILPYGHVYMLFCGSYTHHCSICVRYYCPFCYYLDNKLVPILRCSRCDEILRAIELDDDDVFNKKGLHICTHSNCTPIDGFPITTISMHIGSLFKNGYLDKIKNIKVEDQFKVVQENIQSKQFDVTTSKNRFYNYLELEVYCIADLIANFWDSLPPFSASTLLDNISKVLVDGAYNSVLNNNYTPPRIATQNVDLEDNDNNITNNTSRSGYSLRHKNVDYARMENGIKASKPKRKEKSKVEYYAVWNELSIICKETKGNEVTERRWILKDILTDDYLGTLKVFCTFFQEKYDSSISKNDYCIRFLIYFYLAQRKTGNTPALYDYQLKFRLSQEGKEAACLCIAAEDKKLVNEMKHDYTKRYFYNPQYKSQSKKVANRMERFFYEVPSNAKVTDVVLFTSLYQDGFKALGKGMPQAICFKIDGIDFSQYQNLLFSPPLFISTKQDFKDFFSMYVRCEVLMGRYGFFYKIGKNSFLHVRYCVESVDGDIQAQFLMEGRPGGNASLCPCFMDCYNKRLSNYMTVYLPTTSLLQDDTVTFVRPPVVLPDGHNCLYSLFNSVAMSLFSDAGNFKEWVSHCGYIDNTDREDLLNMITISDRLGFSSHISWMPEIVSENFNVIFLNNIIDNSLKLLPITYQRQLGHYFQNVKQPKLALTKDRFSIIPDINSANKNLIGVDALASKTTVNFDYLEILRVPRGLRDIPDAMHLLSNFGDWLIMTLTNFQQSKVKDSCDSFFSSVLMCNFNSLEMLNSVKQSTIFPDNILVKAMERIEQIRASQNCPSWFTSSLLGKTAERSLIRLLNSEDCSYSELTCHDKIVFLFAFFEPVFQDSMAIPFVFSASIVIRCLSFLYSYQKGDIDDVRMCSCCLSFFLDRMISLLPPSFVPPTVHRLSHFGEYILYNGSMMFHDNFRLEHAFFIVKKFTGNLNNHPITTINNRLFISCTSFLHKKNVVSYKFVFLGSSVDLPFIFGNSFCDIIIKRYFVEDLLFQKGIIHSYGRTVDLLNSNLLENIKTSLNSCLEIVNVKEQDITIDISCQTVFSSIRIKSGDSSLNLKSADRDTLANGYIDVNNDSFYSLNNSIGFIKSQKEVTSVYLVAGYIKVSVNEKYYPLAICIPLRIDDRTIQKSNHLVTVYSNFQVSNAYLISLNQIHIGNVVLSKTLDTNTICVSILSIKFGYYNGTIIIDENLHKKDKRKRIVVSKCIQCRVKEARIKKLEKEIKRLKQIANIKD